MKHVVRGSALLSVLLGACGGPERAPALGLQDEEDDRLGQRSTDLPRSNLGNGGTSALGTGSSGASGSYIPTPAENDPVPTPDPPMGAGGQGGGTGTTTPPSDPCASGAWLGDFVAYSQTSLQALRGYTEVLGNVYIGTSSSSSSTDVTSLSAVGCLELVDGSFTILESPLLSDLSGLEALALVNRFTLSTNAGLETLLGPTALLVESTLHVRANAVLTSLGDGFSGAGEIVISDNPQLPQCRADAFAAGLDQACVYCTGNADGCP